MLITADHGNAELVMKSATGQWYTACTTNPVPLVYLGRPVQIAEHGSSCDIVPSMLYLMNMDVAYEMTRTPLVSLSSGSGDGEIPAGLPATQHG